MRWASPVIYMRRTVTRDIELSGVKMAKGDKVSMWYASANRDEDVFEHSETFDIDLEVTHANGRWSARARA